MALSLRAPALGLVAGWVDVASFLHARVFAGAMTGNTALLGLAIGQGDRRKALWILGIIASFCAGVTLARCLARLRLGHLLSLAAGAAVVVAVAITGVVPRNLPALALAMGLQNGGIRKFAGAALNTTVVTGDLSKLCAALADLVLPGKLTDEQRTMLATIPLFWAAYALGGTLGGWAEGALAHPLLPAGLLMPLALLLPA